LLGPIHSGCLAMTNEKQEKRIRENEKNKNKEMGRMAFL